MDATPRTYRIIVEDATMGNQTADEYRHAHRTARKGFVPRIRRMFGQTAHWERIADAQVSNMGVKSTHAKYGRTDVDIIGNAIGEGYAEVIAHDVNRTVDGRTLTEERNAAVRTARRNDRRIALAEQNAIDTAVWSAQ